MTNSNKEKGELPPPLEKAVAAGSTSSHPVTEFRTSFACMTRFCSDRLHLVDFPAPDITALQMHIQAVWPGGTQECRPFGKGHEIKIRGFPWASVQWRPHDDGKRLFCQILEHLYDRGWILNAAVKAFQHDWDGDTLIFRHQSPPPPPCEWLVIAFDRLDRLLIIGHPPKDLTAGVIDMLGDKLQKHSYPKDGSHVEIKLKGYPWNEVGEATVDTQKLLLRLLDALQVHGFTLYGNVHQLQYPYPDLLVVHRQKDWRPGMPVFQR